MSVFKLHHSLVTLGVGFLLTLAAAGARAGTNDHWKPPGVGTDGHDWVQLKSGEWLRGWLKYVQDKKVEFDSDELEELTLKLKNVRQLYTAKPMYAKFGDRMPVQGLIVVSNESVFVVGPQPLQLPRTELLGITPQGRVGMRHWSGKFVAGLNLRAGNTESIDFSIRGELSRRTPATSLEFNYIGNFARVNGTEDENDQRFNSLYDLRLDRHWFVRALQAELFINPLGNIAYRVMGGIGAGYYFFDEDELVWWVAAGPGFQYTRFDTVQPGEPDHASTPAGILQSNFEMELTPRVDLTLSYQGVGMSRAAGLYTHHSLVELEYEIKRHLDLNIAFVWDYLHEPQSDSGGQIPKSSDLRLTLGLEVRF